MYKYRKSSSQYSETPVKKGVDKNEQKRAQKPIDKGIESKNTDC